MSYPMPPDEILAVIREGTVIPASPLALNSAREFDRRRQTALMRYYCDAGAGGIAVAVHTTQFEIRKPEFNLLEPVLRVCSEAIDSWAARNGKPIVKIAGVVGKTEQAISEAECALSYGYHAGLLSFSAFKGASPEEMIAHAETVARVIPLFGFYLQPSVGGRVLPFDFWKRFSAIPNVVAIKVAPFNRYQTIDVARAVAEVGRAEEITLYTGNDDNIIADLLAPYRFSVRGLTRIIRIRGGLLGQWAVGTKRAVELLDKIHRLVDSGDSIPRKLFQRNIELTDTNAALFDAANGFAGVIPGVHEILRRQGLFEGIWTLNPEERLSDGQMEEIDRVHRAYPRLFDDDFVRERLAGWLKNGERNG
ncbi:MAG: dihydrodipicolinate synthase family protein [Candidatus Latescibacterota bacterium]